MQVVRQRIAHHRIRRLRLALRKLLAAILYLKLLLLLLLLLLPPPSSIYLVLVIEHVCKICIALSNVLLLGDLSALQPHYLLLVPTI